MLQFQIVLDFQFLFGSVPLIDSDHHHAIPGGASWFLAQTEFLAASTRPPNISKRSHLYNFADVLVRLHLPQALIDFGAEAEHLLGLISEI